jgi:hypothetical protein
MDPVFLQEKAPYTMVQKTIYDDKKGHVLLKNQPLAVCDKTASALANLNRKDLYISPATFHYDGGGCC